MTHDEIMNDEEYFDQQSQDRISFSSWRRQYTSYPAWESLVPPTLQYSHSPPSLATSSSSFCVLRRVNVSIFCSWCSCLSAQNSVATFIIRNIAEAENKSFFHKTSINKQTYFQIQLTKLLGQGPLTCPYVIEDCHSVAIPTHMEKIEIFLFHYKSKILLNT